MIGQYGLADLSNDRYAYLDAKEPDPISELLEILFGTKGTDPA